MPIKDHTSTAPCPICNGNAGYVFSAPDRHYGNAGEWDAFRCNTCEHLFQYPILTDKELGKFYPDTYYSFQPPSVNYEVKGLQNRRAWLIFHYLKFFRKYNRLTIKSNFLLAMLGSFLKQNKPLHVKSPLYVPGGKYLDYGCGSGQNLGFMQYAGWDAYGIEISQAAVEAGKKVGLNIAQGSVDKLLEYDSFFDVIYSSHCVEHVSDVKQLFHAFHKALKPGGSLLIEVPSGSAYAVEKFREYFYYLGMPVHVHLFSTQSMKRIAESNGFKDIQLATYSVWDFHAKSYYTRKTQPTEKNTIQFSTIGKDKLRTPKLNTWAGYFYSNRGLKGDNLILVCQK